MKVTIIGGHGKIALLAEPLLVEDGHEVTAWVRNPEHVADVEATGAAAQVRSVEEMSTEDMAAALAGQDAVVWSAGAGGGNPERTYAVDRDAAVRAVDAATDAGVRRFVMVSYFGARTDHGVSQDNPFFHYAEAKAAADVHLRDGAIPWVLLMPSTLTLEPAGGVDLAGDEQAAEPGRVARATVAEMIRAVLLAPPAQVEGRELRFNDGPTPISEALAG